MSLRDRARFSLQRMHGTTSWLTVIPNAGLGHKLEGRDFRFLLKWWLGRPLVPPTVNLCPCCEHQMDPFGDHLVSCSLNQPSQRHNALRDALADALGSFGIAVQKEVAIGGARRPADLALPSFDARGPLAVDLVVHHPLSLSENRSSKDVKASLRGAEDHKVRDSEALCAANGWLFAPMGWHPWAGVGPRGWALQQRLEKQIAGDLQGWPKRRCIQAFRASLTFALMRHVARQLRAAEDALPTEEQGRINPTPFKGGAVFSDNELASWDKDILEEEALFVGAIRIQGKRPCFSHPL